MACTMKRLALVVVVIASFEICLLHAVLGDVPDSCRSASPRRAFDKEHLCIIMADANLLKSFGAVRLTVNCSESCDIWSGHTTEEVEDVDSTLNLLFAGVYNFFSASTPSGANEKTTLNYSPLQQTVVKIRPKQGAKFTLKVTDLPLHMPCVALLLTGLTLFFTASKLSHSIKFYYTGGVGLGVVASVLIVVFILSRFVPKKPAAYTIMLGGWTLSAYIMRKLWENWQVLLVEYQMYVLAYVAAAGFLSFALCYWKGPVKDPRSQQIIQWTIQMLSLVLLYNSSQSAEVSLAIVCAVVLSGLFRESQAVDLLKLKKKASFLKWVWRRGPEPRKLLTEEEYRKQAEVETKKALEELKEYCNSSKCSPWKTMARIKSPIRFVRFMEGESHISDTEMALHDGEASSEETDDADPIENADLITDDETEDSEPNRSNGRMGLVLYKKNYDATISDDDTE